MRGARAFGLGAVLLSLVSCREDEPVFIEETDPARQCLTPNDGCPCDTPGQVVDCGQVEERTTEELSCSIGERTCGTDGKWGACSGDEIVARPLPGASGRETQALAESESCFTNPCDPYCYSFTDTSSGVIAPGFDSTTGLAIEEVEVTEDEDPCEELVMEPAASTIVVTNINNVPPAGLFGEYFTGIDKAAAQIPPAWTPTGTRLDATVGFAWGGSAPGVSGIGADNFSVRWTGTVTPDRDGMYKFATYSDDGMRLWMNGSLIINRWVDQGPTWVETGGFPLVAGTTYDIRVEYYENGGGAHAEIYWEHPTNGWVVIPTSALTPPDSMFEGFTTIPEFIDFDATLGPSGCYNGTNRAIYSINRFDASAIDLDGVFRVFAPVASNVDVDAYFGNFTAHSTVEIVVDALETQLAPSGAIANHDKTPSGTDPAVFLYPYANTVFPLGLAPPLIQYDTGGSAASSVKVILRYPTTGMPTFEWSRIVPESTPPRIAIPEYAWKAFEQTAKGQTAQIAIERVIGGTPRLEKTRDIVFAEAPLRGKIYYTQYGRNGSTKLMVSNPGGSSPPVDAFAGGSDGCPVCHSVSANGRVLATADRGWSSKGGLSELNDTGYFTPTSDHPMGSPYNSGSNDFRGFAWAPLTPDGVYALAANNIYGNTIQQVVGIDTSTDTVSIPSSLISGAGGTGLLAEYFSSTSLGGTRWDKFVPHISHNWADGSGPGGPVPANFSARFSGQIMAYFTETYTLSLRSTDGIRMWVNGTQVIDSWTYNSTSRVVSANVAMTAGQKVDIRVEWRDTAGTAELALEWSSPSTPAGLVPTEMLFPNDGLHGVQATFYNTNNFTGTSFTSLEPNVNHDWGGGSQQGLPADNHSSQWRGRLEAPFTGNIRLCVQSSDDVVVQFNSSTVISQTGSAVDTCSGNIAMTAGIMYTLFVSQREFTGNSYVRLSWESNSFSRTPISIAYLRPPSTYVAPTTGLTVSYYDGDFWTSGQGVNPAEGAFTTYGPAPNENWGNNRPNYSLMTSSDTFSGRWIGSINLTCSGIYEFQSVSDDAAALWIGNNRVLSRTNNGTSTGAAYFEAGSYQFKYQMQETGGGAAAQLTWIPRCEGQTSYSTIPSARLSPTGTGAAGFVRSGGDNGNGSGYYVWETPSTGTTNPPIDVTADTPGRWGLGTTAMMVPSFAPDGSKLVFVDGDSSGGAGWRKGLSVFDFDQGAKIFWNRRNVVSTWPYGHVIKWPVFESDSRTVLYSASTAVDWCCKGGWTTYGHMAPTNYFETPGVLYSVDTESGAPQAVELQVLNEGERAIDANKSYQPTVLPTAAAGYRWVVFTSTRPYGNTFNVAAQNDYSNPASFTPMVNNSNLQSTLWIAAIDDTPSAGTDRSHPAFLLPNQNYSESSSTGFLNERGFWTLDECRAVGVGPDSLCEVDEDCCGGTGSDPTAVCKLDVPVSSPPVRHCQTKPAVSECVPRGDSCGGNDCCNEDVCVNAVCTEPPPITKLKPVNFTRDFIAECPNSSTAGTWRYFDWKADTPGDSYIEFYAQSVSDPADFETLPVAPDAVASTKVIGVGMAAGPTPPGWVGNNVGTLLDAVELPHLLHLRITMRFVPSTDNQHTPVLREWRQSYSCLPDQ